MRPSGAMSWRSGRLFAFQNSTSLASPKVHTMRMPVPFSGSAWAAGRIGTGAPIERRDRGLAEEVAIARVVGVRGQRHAGAEQLGPRGRDHDLAAALDREAQVDVGALARAVLDLGLRHRGLEVDVPHRRRDDA